MEIAIAINMDLDDIINSTAKIQAFITLKDHKQNLRTSRKCKLINPTKSEIGQISKQIFERANNKIRKATGLNQWKNTKSFNGTIR